MRNSLVAVLVVGLLAWLAPGADAQSAGEVFRKVAPSVVVIRAKGRDVAAGGQTGFNETGSGVLISPDGKVMTAAHVVHSMDEISVEFLGGETVSAKVVASEPGLDGQILSDQIADLLNLPPGATGYLIKNVAKGSPADDAGMRGGTIFATIGGEQIVLGGDIILSMEGIPATAANIAKVRDLLSTRAPGSPFTATVLRAGKVLEMSGRLP